MEDKDTIVSKKIVDGIEITEYKDGHTTFVPVKDTSIDTEDSKISNVNEWNEPKRKSRNILERFEDWWKGLKVKPYVKIRDFADPFNDRTDIDAGSDGVKGIEAGIRIDF